MVSIASRSSWSVARVIALSGGSRPARPTGLRRRTRRGGYCRTLIVARARGRSRGYARPRACHPRVTPSANAGRDAPRRGPAARGRGRRHGGRRGPRPGTRHRPRHRRARPGVRPGGRVGGDRGALARAARRSLGSRVCRGARRPRPSADPGRDRRRRHRPRGPRTWRADRPDRGAGGARWPALVRPGPRRRTPPATRGPPGVVVRGRGGGAPAGLLAARRSPRARRHGGHPPGSRGGRPGDGGPGVDRAAARPGSEGGRRRDPGGRAGPPVRDARRGEGPVRQRVRGRPVAPVADRGGQARPQGGIDPHPRGPQAAPAGHRDHAPSPPATRPAPAMRSTRASSWAGSTAAAGVSRPSPPCDAARSPATGRPCASCRSRRRSSAWADLPAIGGRAKAVHAARLEREVLELGRRAHVVRRKLLEVVPAAGSASRGHPAGRRSRSTGRDAASAGCGPPGRPRTSSRRRGSRRRRAGHRRRAGLGSRT